MLLETGKIITSSDVSFSANQVSGSNDRAAFNHTKDNSDLTETSNNTADLTVDIEEFFTDSEGNRVSVGDDVSIYWPKEQSSYKATVTEIDPDLIDYTVVYLDEDPEYVHRISDVKDMQVKRILTARSHQAIAVHDSVAEYVDALGNVRQELISNKESLPQRELPEITRNQITIPNSAKEALESPQAFYWLQAMLNEVHGHTQPLQRNPTFGFTRKHSIGRQLNLKWVFKIKWNGDELVKFKARLTVAGWGLKQGTHYVENYTGTAPIGDLYLLESLKVLYNLDNYEDDLVQAYCNVPMPPQPNGQPVIVSSIPLMPVLDSHQQICNIQLIQALYGHPASGFALAADIHSRLLNRHKESNARPCPINFQQCPSQPVIFKANFSSDSPYYGGCFILWINNDNIRSYVSKDISARAYPEFRQWLTSIAEVTGGAKPLNDLPPDTCLGVQFCYNDDGSTTASMQAYIHQALIDAGMEECNPAPTPINSLIDCTMSPTTDDEKNEVINAANKLFGRAIIRQYGHPLSTYSDVTRYYAQHVSTIGWIAKQIGPSIALAHSILGRVMHAPCVQGFMSLKRVYRYLKDNTNMCIHLSTDKLFIWGKDFPQFYMQSDASLADDLSDRRSQGGHIGGLERLPSYWGSQKSKRVCTSTNHVETHHSSLAAQLAVYINNLLKFLGVHNNKPIMLELDNFATVCTSGALIRKFSPKQKHFHIDEFFTAECVENNIITLSHVPGSTNLSDKQIGFPVDAMTKPLSAPLLRHYFPYLHGAAGGDGIRTNTKK